MNKEPVSCREADAFINDNRELLCYAPVPTSVHCWHQINIHIETAKTPALHTIILLLCWILLFLQTIDAFPFILSFKIMLSRRAKGLHFISGVNTGFLIHLHRIYFRNNAVHSRHLIYLVRIKTKNGQGRFRHFYKFTHSHVLRLIPITALIFFLKKKTAFLLPAIQH